MCIRDSLYDAGMTKEYAAKIIQFVKNRQLDLSWSAFSMDEWLVEDTDDPRIIREEYYVKARAKRGTVNALEDGANVNKILCICNPGHILEIEQEIGAAFPDCSIAKSSDILLEIMGKGITKAHAVHRLCSMWGLSLIHIFINDQNILRHTIAPSLDIILIIPYIAAFL